MLGLAVGLMAGFGLELTVDGGTIDRGLGFDVRGVEILVLNREC